MGEFFAINKNCVEDVLLEVVHGPVATTLKEVCKWAEYGGTDESFAQALMYVYCAPRGFFFDKNGSDELQRLLYDRKTKTTYLWTDFSYWEKTTKTHFDLFAPVRDMFVKAKGVLDAVEARLAVEAKQTDNPATLVDLAKERHRSVVELRKLVVKAHGKLLGHCAIGGAWAVATSGQGSLGDSGENWDTQEAIVNTLPVANGILRFDREAKSVKFECPSPHNRFLLRAAVRYELKPKGELWADFLKALTFEDVQKMRWLQQIVGLSLLRDACTPGPCMYFLTGPNDREKRLFLRTLQAALGNLCHGAWYHSPETVDEEAVRSKCLLFFGDPSKNGMANANAMKRMTQGETVSYFGWTKGGRWHSKSFRATAFPFYCVKKLPTLTATDFGITRRLMAVPFTASVNENPEAERRLLTDTDELEAVLKWAVDGALFPDMVETPKDVAQATQQWLKALNAS